MGEYYIITTAHKALWPSGVLLFWAPNRNGYSTFLEAAGRYSQEEAEAICKPRDSSLGLQEFMVPCMKVEAQAVSVVDIDKMKELTGHPRDYR